METGKGYFTFAGYGYEWMMAFIKIYQSGPDSN